MNLKNYVSNTVIIGGGPSGIFAALELSKNNINTILMERESKLGGMAFQFDVNLDYSKGLPLRSPLGKQIFGNRTIANKLIAYVHGILKNLGLPISESLQNTKYKNPICLQNIKNIQYIDPGIIPVHKKNIDYILNNLEKELRINKNLKILLNCNAEIVHRGKYKRWQVIGKNQNNLIRIEADNVIIATGRRSVKWVIKILENLRIPYLNNPEVDIGIRIEGLSKYFKCLTEKSLNPKIIIKYKNTLTRTFCWCVGGKVISYEFCGAKILDGQHSYLNPTLNTNFGIVTTISLPTGSSNTVFGINFAKFLNSVGAGEVIIQLLRDFIKNKQTISREINSNIVQPTLNNVKIANIRAFLPPLMADRIIQTINVIDKICNNNITKNCLVYAPVVERVFPFVPLNYQMETPKQGLFLIGDCSGKTTGIISGAAMGIAAVRYITKLCEKKLFN